LYLSREEERALDGELGPGLQLAMRILVKLGDLFGAERLLPIRSAHVSGVSYKTVGDVAIGFLEELVEMGARASVPATTNPCGFDERLKAILDLPDEVVAAQERLVDLYSKLGLLRTLTCVPYYQLRPEEGSHLAWAESSAVVYANSVLGALTNREGSPSALAAAIAGRTPDYGLHRPENREPGLLVDVLFNPRDELELWALGFLVGQVAGDAVPLLRGLRGLPDWELKGLGASMASGGMTAMFMLEGGRPRPRGPLRELEKLQVGREDLSDVMDKLSSPGEPDMVFVGCPHCSREELELIARLLKGRRTERPLWVCTSRHVRASCPEAVRALEASGALVVVDTCVVVSWVERLGVDLVATNSPKAAYYLPGLSGVQVRLASLRECVELACSRSSR